jgi:hypothetical protein|tara:strand:+ start:260 stop:436 length:177 start_codon:yes stop_codon:yes gene_type:complete
MNSYEAEKIEICQKELALLLETVNSINLFNANEREIEKYNLSVNYIKDKLETILIKKL